LRPGCLNRRELTGMLGWMIVHNASSSSALAMSCLLARTTHRKADPIVLEALSTWYRKWGQVRRVHCQPCQQEGGSKSRTREECLDVTEPGPRLWVLSAIPRGEPSLF
jgi:hypothetical protein